MSNVQWSARKIALIVILAALALYLAVFGLITPGTGRGQTASMSSGCTSGEASWGVPLQALGVTVKKTAFWGRMTQQACLAKQSGLALGDPVVTQGVGGFASSIGWHYDGVTGGGQKFLTPDHSVARTKRILHFTDCAPQPFGCIVTDTYTMKLFLWWSRGPGDVVSVHQ